jgi:hypothetical protein
VDNTYDIENPHPSRKHSTSTEDINLAKYNYSDEEDSTDGEKNKEESTSWNILIPIISIILFILVIGGVWYSKTYGFGSGVDVTNNSLSAEQQTQLSEIQQSIVNLYKEQKQKQKELDKLDKTKTKLDTQLVD